MKMNKIKILWWVITLLAILNITTICTIIYHNHKDFKDSKAIIIEPDSAPLNGKCFRQTLGFDKEQMKDFRKFNKKFHKDANEIIESINIEKNYLFEELQNESPNSDKLNSISNEIGVLHKNLKMVTIDFYLSLKGICNATQKEKLKTMFIPLFKDTGLKNGCGNNKNTNENCLDTIKDNKNCFNN